MSRDRISDPVRTEFKSERDWRDHKKRIAEIGGMSFSQFLRLGADLAEREVM